MDTSEFYTKKDREIEKLFEKCQKYVQRITVMEQESIELQKEKTNISEKYESAKIEISELKSKALENEEFKKKNEILNGKQVSELKENIVQLERKLETFETAKKNEISKKLLKSEKIESIFKKPEILKKKAIDELTIEECRNLLKERGIIRGNQKYRLKELNKRLEKKVA